MGIQKVSIADNAEERKQFTNLLLKDLEALAFLLEHNWFEKDITRVGAEQEVFLVEKESLKPASINQKILGILRDKAWLKAELGKFNLETNLQPYTLKGSCFKKMELENLNYLKTVREVAQTFDVDVLLTGILPTLYQYDMQMHNLTPNERSQAVLQATLNQLPDKKFKFHISGIDDLIFQSSSPLYPASSTSFQVHLQVAPHEFALYYNIAQALAGPILAIASNSPLAFGKRLWHESRIILYQQASDTSQTNGYLRKRRPRVVFGEDWVESSVLDIYKEDIARFPILLSGDIDEDPFAKISQHQAPSLEALQIHNSTIYRWNRPCYGISPNGQPHLRIENRMLPSGPTIVDEIANSALWIGAMIGIANEIGDIRTHIDFVEVKDNFDKAAKNGIHSEITWLNHKKIRAKDLLLNELLPLAKKGLLSKGVNSDEVDYYLGIIEQRTEKSISGSSWMLKSYNQLLKQTNQQKALTTLTKNMLLNQWEGKAVHEWELARLSSAKEDANLDINVEDLMQVNPLTIYKYEALTLAKHIMEWKKLDSLVVEDEAHLFLGVILREDLDKPDAHFVHDILKTDIEVATPQMSFLEASSLLKRNRLTHLPVVQDALLVGVLKDR
jgi:hypothetical protein